MSQSILATLLADALKQRGLSERETAKQIGVSPTTINRAIKGESVDVDTLIMICGWLGVSPSQVLDAMLPSNTSLVSALTTIVEADPRLVTIFDEAMVRLENHEIEVDDLRDLIRYAVFRLGLYNGKTDRSDSP